MRCAKVTQQLSAFLDGELTPPQAERIREHLESCPDCRKERQALELTINSVKALPAMQAPSDLASRVMAGIEEAEAQPAEPATVLKGRFGLRLLWPAAAALIIGIGIALLSPSMRGGRLSKLNAPPKERPVAMARSNIVTDRDNADAEVDADDGYGYWAEGERALRREATPGMKQEVRSRERLDRLNKEMASPDHPSLEEKRIATGDVLRLPATTEQLKETDEDALLAFRKQDGQPLQDLASATDAIATMLVEEIEIRSEDPQAAYAKVAAISANLGGAKKLPDYGRPMQRGKLVESVPQKIVLDMTSSQLARIKKEILVAGLIPAKPAKLRGALAAPADGPAQAERNGDLLPSGHTRRLYEAGRLGAGKVAQERKAAIESMAKDKAEVKPDVSGPEAAAEEAAAKSKLGMALKIAEKPARIAGKPSAEPLIRVSISFVKAETKAAAAEALQTDIEAQKE